jgi:hypothetical protein
MRPALSLADRAKNDGTSLQEAAWALRREYGKVMDMSERLLGKITSRPSGDPDEWIRSLREEFEQYRAHFIRQIALEEKSGHLSSVSDDRPGMLSGIERLRHEHDELVWIMTSIYQEVHELTPVDRLAVRDCCCRIQNLLAYVAEHEQEENKLLSEVLSRDLGVHGD